MVQLSSRIRTQNIILIRVPHRQNLMLAVENSVISAVLVHCLQTEAGVGIEYTIIDRVPVYVNLRNAVGVSLHNICGYILSRVVAFDCVTVVHNRALLMIPVHILIGKIHHRHAFVFIAFTSI